MITACDTLHDSMSIQVYEQPAKINFGPDIALCVQSTLLYPPFTPDVIVDQDTIDLNKYGVNGKIIPIKGAHTPGDLLVLIGKNLFVGDVFVGTFKAQAGGIVADD